MGSDISEGSGGYVVFDEQDATPKPSGTVLDFAEWGKRVAEAKARAAAKEQRKRGRAAASKKQSRVKDKE